jgi:hypothetical protein
MSYQVSQGPSSVMLQIGGAGSHYTGYIFRIPTDDQGGVSLKAPLRVLISNDADGSHIENEELSISGFGESIGDAFDDLIAYLVATWNGLKDAKDSELTPDAIELRDRLMLYFPYRRDMQSP